jgi:hypothetical protein
MDTMATELFCLNKLLENLLTSTLCFCQLIYVLKDLM